MHCLLILCEGIPHHASHIGEVAHEFRLIVGEHPQHILIYQYLTIASRTGADANGGNGQLAGDPGGKLCRNAL